MRTLGLAAFLVAVALALIVGNIAIARGPGGVTAPEIARLSVPVSVPTAEATCPPAPSFDAVLAAPATYRGRCVYLVGLLGPRRDDGGQTVRLDLPAPADRALLTATELVSVSGGGPAIPANQPSGAVWVDLGTASGDFWDTAPPGGLVGVLGTIEGTEDGLVQVAAADTFYARGTPVAGT